MYTAHSCPEHPLSTLCSLEPLFSAPFLIVSLWIHLLAPPFPITAFPSSDFISFSQLSGAYPLLFGSHIPCVRKHPCLWSLVLELESGALVWLVYRGFNSVPWVFPNPWSHIVRWLYTVSGTQYVLSKVRYHYCWDRLDPERFHWMLVKMNREYEECKYSLR